LAPFADEEPGPVPAYPQSDDDQDEQASRVRQKWQGSAGAVQT
jgi:hypothetical protein